MHDPIMPQNQSERTLPPDALAPGCEDKPVRRIRRAVDIANLTPATSPLEADWLTRLQAYKARGV
jgi:hypothetical protein